MQLVKILNPSHKRDANYRTLRLVHQEEVIEIEPGADRIVLFEVAAAFFGNPRATNTSRSRDRVDTYNQIRFMWGYQLGQPDADEQWEVIKPPFRVETLEGEYLPMVLDDPDGVLPLPGDDTSVQIAGATPETALLRAMIEKQNDSIEQLTRLLADRELASNPGVVPDAPNIPAAPADAPQLNPTGAADPTNLPTPPANEAPPTVDGPKQPKAQRGTTLGGS